MNTSSSEGTICRNSASPKPAALSASRNRSGDVSEGDRNRCSTGPDASTLTHARLLFQELARGAPIRRRHFVADFLQLALEGSAACRIE